MKNEHSKIVSEKLPHLFSPLQLGYVRLAHRVVMAPLTRMRSAQPGNVPQDINAEYYSQRATEGGLIITEATQISAQGLGYLPGPESWRWMLGVVAIPSAAFFALLFGIVESPRWLVKAGRPSEADAILRRLGHTDPAAKVIEIENSLVGDGAQDRLFQRLYLGPIFLAWAIAMFNQLSGINALMYYAPRIFEMTGAGESLALLQSIAVGGTNLIFTLIGMSLIDWVGRRQLIIWGSFGYIVSLVTIAWGFHHYAGHFDQFGSRTMLVSILVFQAAHAVSQGAVIWVFISEIFPNAVRTKGQALGSATHWTMAAAISWMFPIVANWSGAGAFAFFAAMMVLQLLFAWKIMPETRGTLLESASKVRSD